MNPETHPNKKRRLTLPSRISLVLGLGAIALSVLGSLAFNANWDIFPREIKGPHPILALVGELLSNGAFYAGLLGFLVGIMAFATGLFRKPHAINIGAGCLGLLLSYASLSNVTMTLDRMREAQREISCYNLRDLGYRLKKYGKEHYGQLPHTINWCDELIEFDSYSSQEMRKGWVKNDEGLSEFAFNANLSEQKFAEVPKNTVLLFETKLAKNPAGGAELINAENHPLKGCFVLFGDMHVEFVRAEDFNNLRWKP